MKKVGIVYDPIYAQHDTGRHPENANRVLFALEQLKRYNIVGDNSPEHFVSIPARKATIDQIHWVHSDETILKIQQIVEKARETNQLMEIDSDTTVWGDSFNASLTASGGNFAAIDAMLDQTIDRGFVLCRPPGHHSNQSECRGFCLFNNIALAVNYLTREKGIERVAILDFDAHAGNGTEEIFYNGLDQGELLFISTHQDPRTLYPGTCFPKDMGNHSQKGKVMNITFPPGGGDQCMTLAMEQLILPLFKSFQPQFILISAGFDAWHQDPLTNLGFTQQMYGKIIEMLDPIAEKYASDHILGTLEGGYNIKAVANSIINVIQAEAQDKNLFEEENVQENSEVIQRFETKIIPELHELFLPYWETLK